MLGSIISFFLSLTFILCKFKSISSLLLIFFELFITFAIFAWFLGWDLIFLFFFIIFLICGLPKLDHKSQCWSYLNTCTHVKPQKAIYLLSLKTFSDSQKYVVVIFLPHFYHITSRFCPLIFIVDILASSPFVCRINSISRSQIYWVHNKTLMQKYSSGAKIATKIFWFVNFKLLNIFLWLSIVQSYTFLFWTVVIRVC